MLDLLIKGGWVVTPGGVGDHDVGVQGTPCPCALSPLPSTVEVHP